MCILSHQQLNINGDLDIIIICMSRITKVNIEHGSFWLVWEGGGLGGSGVFLFVKKSANSIFEAKIVLVACP